MILLQKSVSNIYKIEKNEIEMFLEQQNALDFVIFEKRMTWLLIFDHHRKLIGLGDYIKKKIKQKVSLSFGKSKIEYFNLDTI